MPITKDEQLGENRASDHTIIGQF